MIFGTDISITWDPVNARGDWSVAAGDLRTGNALETAVLLSLFTDRVASPDFLPNDGTDDRRGWWGDSYERSPIGSRLWQLERAKKSDAAAVLRQARDFGREALQWLLDDGVAASVDVQARWVTPSRLGVLVVIQEPRHSVPTAFAYAWAWNGIGN